jgi:hypothetical protein
MPVASEMRDNARSKGDRSFSGIYDRFGATVILSDLPNRQLCQGIGRGFRGRNNPFVKQS